MPLPMFDKNPKKKIKNIIAIAAGKGGVGKSTITVNIALALRKIGFTVGIIDADLYGPSLRKMLPEETLPIQKGDKIKPALCGGIPVISMAYFRREGEASAVRAPIANGIINQFINNVEWDNLDFLLIDFPPGTGDIQLTLSQKANLTAAIMVTTPQQVAVMDVKKAIDLFDQVRVPILGIIENMSHYLINDDRVYIFGKEGGKKLARETGAPFLGEVPIDPQLCSCGDLGQSIFEITQSNKLTIEAFLSIAQNIVSHSKLLEKENMNCLEEFELIWKEI